MKHALRLICALAAALLLAGCTVPEPPVVTTTAPPETSAPTTAPTLPAALVTDHMDKTLTWTDAVGNPCACRIRIPQVYPFSDDAEAVSREILDECIPYLEETEQASKHGYSAHVIEVNYRAVTAKGVVSILVWADSGTDYILYHTYNLDTLTGNRLEDSALPGRMGLEDVRWQTDLRQAAERAFARFYPTADMSIAEFREVYEATVSAENLQKAKPYLTEAGTVGVVLNVYSVAGADFYPQLLEDIT